ncbi:MAG: outer membrane protein, OmpA/MotB family [Deltaproteobacteria bacterium]|nr:outer membrane protein, OmpA/MotB family [Deltaproteobacteria bacterium]
MKSIHSRRAAFLAISVSLFLAVGMLLPVSGFSQAQQTQAPQKNTVPDGKPTTVKGVILTRDGETFVMRDMSRTDTVVLLTETTKIRTERKGLLRGHQPFDVTALMPGLIVEVKGKGDSTGRLVAEDIQFSEADLKAAITANVRTAPVEKKSDEALKEVADANKRISSLDQYDVVKTVTVLFAVNSPKLSKDAMAQLDDLASKAPGAKNYTVEVLGFADKTGNFEKNLELSQKRANSVVQYLSVKHNIPLRRITVPMGYGSTKPAGDEKTAAGREQSRRVEVRVLVNKGLNQ